MLKECILHVVAKDNCNVRSSIMESKSFIGCKHGWYGTYVEDSGVHCEIATIIHAANKAVVDCSVLKEVCTF